VRGAIVTRIRAGRTNREIADFNNLSVNTVKSFAREYHNFIQEGGQDEDF
jgi:DNA-binding NarL/FixJ family response regulator